MDPNSPVPEFGLIPIHCPPESSKSSLHRSTCTRTAVGMQHCFVHNGPLFNAIDFVKAFIDAEFDADMFANMLGVRNAADLLITRWLNYNEQTFLKACNVRLI